jgi:lipoprotein signal peptidase
MKGCVVDMFHFPMFSFDLFGRHFEFFSYIFNVADDAINYMIKKIREFIKGSKK